MTATLAASREPGTEPVEVAYFLRSWPRLSQTFILDEILMLERMGIDLCIFALTDPCEPVVQPDAERVRAPVLYLDEISRSGIPRLRAHAAAVLRAPRRYRRARGAVSTLREEERGYESAPPSQCLDFALHLTRLLRRSARRDGVVAAHLHAHFAHDPTLVAQLTHTLTGIPYSFTTHARDLYQVAPGVLLARAKDATAIVTCCRPNVDYLERTLPPDMHAKVRLIHHGKDLAAIPFAARHEPDSSTPAIVSVGRLVEKKGFADLLSACHALRQEGHHFTCAIFGDGPESASLSALVDSLGLADVVTLAGARPRNEILAAYREADVFALTPFVTDSGDRDGIPNVLIEAMASGLPVVATSAGGIPELVKHGDNGLLARPQSTDEIAAHLAAVLGDGDMRARLGAAARHTVEELFDARTSTKQLVELFEGVPCKAPDPEPA